jgi:hypothetical protein
MRIKLRGAGVVVDVDDGALIGVGGEGRVYALGADRVVKLYHPDQRPSPTRVHTIERLQAARASGALRGGVLDDVIFPDDVAVDGENDVIGVVMARVDGAVELAALWPHRRPPHLSCEAMRLMLLGLLARVDALHAAGVVVGDLNDGNVLVRGTGSGDAALIDTDSVQFEGSPCPVAHERTLDPRLYGVNLAAAPAFSNLSDHYALRVLALQLFCGVHPYGGVHGVHSTMLRRAAARWSVFRDDVRLPKSAKTLGMLSDALRDDFRACFDDDVRVPLVAAALAVPFVRCGCGLEHAQQRCPACTTMVPRAVVQQSARFDLIKVAPQGHDADATVVAATFDGALRTVTRHVAADGRITLRREDGGVVVDGDSQTGMVIAIDGPRTWLALPADAGGLDGAALVAVAGGAVVDRTSTGLSYGAPAFCVSPVGVCRLSGDAIVHHPSGALIGRALIGATTLFATDDGCLALWRAGRVQMAVWCRPGHGAKDIVLPPVDGKVTDLEVVSVGELAVVTMFTSHGGVTRRRCTVVSQRRGVLSHTDVDDLSADAPWLRPDRPRTLVGTHLVAVVDDGIAVVDVGGAQPTPSTVLSDLGEAFATLLPEARALFMRGDDLLVYSRDHVTRCRRR